MQTKTIWIIVPILLTVTNVRSEDAMSNSFQQKLALNVLLDKPNINMVVAPLALKLPLCKLANVASGVAKHELMTALGFFKENMTKFCYLDPKDAITLLKESNLILLNKIYLHAKYKLNPKFSANLTEVFGVQVDTLGFDFPKAATSFINRWIETATYRRIQDLLSPTDIDKDTSMVIVNAAHFKVAWEFSFEIKMSKIDKFHHLNNSISIVPMMTQNGEFLFMQDEVNDFKLVTMYMRTWGGHVTFVVPGSIRGLPKLLQQLKHNPDLIRNAKKSAKYTQVSVTLPRFKIKTSLDWNSYLKQIGIKKIFDVPSGLEDMLISNKSTDIPFLSKAKQQVFIEVDEYGPFRAVTNAVNEYESYLRNREYGPKSKRKELIGDRPFLFTVNVLGGEEGGADPAGYGRGGGRGAHAPLISTNEMFVGVYYGPQ